MFFLYRIKDTQEIFDLGYEEYFDDSNYCFIEWPEKIRNLISNILKDKNYSVREAANYDQAVFEIDKKLPDIAIVDVKLDKGDKDGIDLLKKIKSMSDLVPVTVSYTHLTLPTKA